MHSDDASSTETLDNPHTAAPRTARLSSLARESRRKDEFIATVAHELRNMMAPLDAALEILEHGRDDPLTVDRALPVARRQVKHLCQLVDDLLDVGRIVNDQLALERTVLELQQIVEETAAACRPMFAARHQALTRERAHTLMELVGLDPATYADRYPHQLSGGQQQRVGVARALAADPPVLLMDEPFGAVDPVVRVRLQDEFLRLQQELDKTVVMVTHDIDEAVKMGERVAVFAAGGRLAQYATPAEILARPADDVVSDFVGSTSGLRRLSVTPLSRELLEPMDGVRAGELGAAIDLDSTLEQALAAMLRDDRPMVGVKDGAQFVGVLTPLGVHRALRASLAE
jgi:ABC-type proline/glycine betaine transport system ATPase subunit